MTTEQPGQQDQNTNVHQLQQLPGALIEDTPATAKTTTAAAVEQLLRAKDSVGEWLTDRGDDLRRAVKGGWKETDDWIKAALGGLALLVVVWVGGTLLTVLLKSIVALASLISHVHVDTGARSHTGLLATITEPVRTYLAGHTRGLAAGSATAYAAWQLAVLVTGFLSWATTSFGARFAWGVVGAGTAWMVWSGAPATGREVATGLTALAWGLLSIVALRGFRIRGL
ncbi:hypothetical protein [Streptomyces sp. CT34]|uniref:hypothetical protein n=1 Tax=Streptomyces sp. CT34 TaxID=1553907 RepID=UPI00068CDA02|nr:hypothetical protein [Streptomyces sp. CT34]